jgi:hypothetical protein
VATSVMGMRAVMEAHAGFEETQFVMMRMARAVRDANSEDGGTCAGQRWTSAMLRRRVRGMKRLVRVIGSRMMGSPVVHLGKRCSAPVGSARIAIYSVRR